MQAFVLMGCTFCSDYFIYAFIPSSWIFFVASTYVWTQQLFTPGEFCLKSVVSSGPGAGALFNEGSLAY